ncbi:MAG: hypothetical protein JNL90_18650 [Planctomycetes bacterium]|nr:hypothetical protein [Planctomycetota bacterium]
MSVGLHRRSPRRRARAALLLLPPLLLGVAPLLLPSAQDEGARGRDGDGGGGGEGDGADDLEARDVPPPQPWPAFARVEGGDRERSAPCLVASADGGAWLVAHEWRAGEGDYLAARRVAADGRAEPPIELTAAPALRGAPCAALDRGGRLHVFWSELEGDGARLRGARVDAAGEVTAFAPLTAGAAARDPDVARAADGTLWLAWEQWVAGSDARGGSFDVHVAPLLEDESGARLGPARAVGTSRGSDLDPALARAGETLFVAWSSFVERDYEVLLQPLVEGAPLESISAESAADDLHPALAGAPDGALWIAWDRLVDSARGSSLPRDQPGGRRGEQSVHVRVARRDGAGVTLPAAAPGWIDGALPGAPLLGWGGGAPKLVVDAAGRPCVAYRYVLQSKSRDRRSGSPLLLQWLEAGGWSAAHELAASAGLGECGALALVDGAVWAAAQADRRFQIGSLWNGAAMPALQKTVAKQRGDEYATWIGPSAIAVGRMELPARVGEGGAAATAPRVAREVRRSTPHFHPAGERADDPYVTGASRHVVARGEQRFTVWYGDLHRHTSLSRCSRGIEPLPEDRYAFARDVYGDDFLAITDHAGHLDPGAWARLTRLLAFERTETLLPLCGYECSSRSQGHVNVLFADANAPLLSLASQDDANALRWLCAQLPPERALVIPHTSADPGRKVDFRQCDPRVTPLLEIYQSLRGSFEFDGCWRQSSRALANGGFAVDAVREQRGVGFVASSDHGSGAAYAGVLAESLAPDALFAALRARRTFAATARGLFVELRVDDALMGESVRCAAPPRVRLVTRMLQPIQDVLLLRDGRPWRRLGREREPAQADVALEFVIPQRSLPLRADLVVRLEVDAGRLVAPGARRISDPSQPSLAPIEGGVEFRWPKAAFAGDRDGYRLRLRAPREAVVTVTQGTQVSRIAVAKLLAEGFTGRLRDSTWQLIAHERHDTAVAEQKGLGVAELVQEWVDDEVAPGPTSYYARVIQADGETAWTSPIWVTRE